MQVVRGESRDVCRNLAVEEWLLDHAGETGPILFLYVNSPCVVIGKNQNPWRECRLSLMERDHVLMVRRISGGGAVYHDEGNLNFSVIVPRAEYREEKQYELILHALKKVGIDASRLGKSSLAVAGKKFSGQAFCFRRAHVLHHGTLLVSSDLVRLGCYLGSEVGTIETHAVASVPAEVVNLSSIVHSLTIERLSDSIVESFRVLYGQGEVVSGAPSGVDLQAFNADLMPVIERNCSCDWNYGRTPRFQMDFDGHSLQVEKGRIVNLDGAPLLVEWLPTE